MPSDSTKLSDLDLKTLTTIRDIFDRMYPEPKVTSSTTAADLPQLKYEAGRRSAVLDLNAAINLASRRLSEKVNNGRNPGYS